MIYRFGEFQLDTERLELRHGGDPRDVEPQVFDLLSYLIEHGEAAHDAAAKAIDLDAGLPEAHFAMAQYYWIGLGDFDAALDEIAIAESLAPGTAGPCVRSTM